MSSYYKSSLEQQKLPPRLASCDRISNTKHWCC